MPKAVILTALEVEFLSVRDRLSNRWEEVHEHGTIYERGEFDANGQVWKVAVAQIGKGNERAAAETERALSHFNPGVALFVGVAGGLKDVGLGDVVAATKVYAYEHGKAGEAFLPRPEIGNGSYPLVQRAKQVARDKEWQRRITPTIKGTSPKAVVEPIAAGAQVVSSDRAPTFDFLRSTYSDAVAVEMEGYGFHEAVRATHGVHALVVRGISDLIEDKAQSDSEGWQPKAASHAAAFAFEVLARFQIGGKRTFEESALHLDPQQLPTDIETTVRPQVPPVAVRGVVPPGVRSFAGRVSELEQIRSLLTSDAHGEPAIVAIHGLSGVGKTQLCRKYLEVRQADYNLTYWISGGDQAQVTSGLAQLAQNLRPSRFDPNDSISSARVALQWLQDNDGWLLVFDGASPQTISSLLPTSGAGHILITSNDPNWSSITRHETRLQGLASEDAVQFLLQRTGLTQSESAARIADAFDCLPLALEQAAAYIATNRIDFDAYERLLEQHRPALLDEKSPFTEYPESVYSALRLNVQSAFSNVPNVVILLNVVAFMDSSGIPRGLASDAVHIYLEQQKEHFDDLVFNRLVAELLRVSLIAADSELVSTHPLVQAFVRDNLPEEDQIAWSRFTVSILALAFPVQIDDSSTWPRCEALIDHVTTALRLTDYQNWGDEYVLALYINGGSYLHARGRDEQSYELLSRALEQAISTHGHDHPQVALVSINVVDVLADLDQSDEALTLGERAVDILTKHREIRGRNAIELGKLYSNLGRIYLHHKKDFVTARSYFARALTIHRKRLGEDHYTTAIDINNIGTVDRAEGKWADAYDNFKEAVRIHRGALSPSDFRLAIALYNLSTAAFNLKRFEEAEACAREAIEINEVLQGGAKNWDQMDALFGLGISLRALRRPRESLIYFDRAIEIGTSLYGRESRSVQSAIAERGAAAFEVIEPYVCKRD